MARSKKVEPKVRQLLEQRQMLRSSDKALLLAFWAEEGFHLSGAQETIFMSCTPAESITRARRALRDELPGDKETEQKRYERFEEEQEDHSEKKPWWLP